MKNLGRSLLGAAAMFLVFQGIGMADKGPNEGAKGEGSPTSQAVADYAMAEQLVTFGIAHSDPISLVTAARVMQMAPAKESKRTKTSEGGSKESGAKAEHKLDLTTPAGVLAKAREMAGDRKDILAMIDDAAAGASRGRMAGPVVHRDRVNSGTTDVYEEKFEGLKVARVLIDGDGDTDLDCFIEDENHNRVDSDTDGTDTCLLEWTPAWTGTFFIKIKNYGSVYNNYVLATN
ncbi:MAG: hypothetical protein HQL57_08185 [Magnetococcales bacterium]|nr:hypothetical protein [Magnetococcales bacterium]MBF0157146.1 hypothetical protein [Magnetococcales bacterium]